MELMDAIRGRRSIRKFKTQPVEEEKLAKILEAAHAAPSASNYTYWYFIVVGDAETKKKFSQCFYREVMKYKKTLNQTWQERLKNFSTDFVLNAPLLIVVCADPDTSKPGEPGHGQHILSTCAAIENLMLAAYGEGLGSVWITRYNKSEVRSLLKIPPKIVPLGVIPIGYPDQVLEKSAFASAGFVPDELLDDHVFVEEWGNQVGLDL